MMRRYIAVGALAAVAVLVAAVVVLVMPQTHEPVPSAPSAASAPSASTPPASPPARRSASTSTAAAHAPVAGVESAAVPVAREAAARAAGAGGLNGGLFMASYPVGWHLSSARANGAARFQLSTTGAPIGSLGIGPAGTVGVTVDESRPESRLRAFAHDAARLLPLSVGTPRGALDVALSAPARTVQLDGVEAAEESYTYSYGGRQNVQSDVLALRGERLVLVELDGEPSAARSAQAGFAALMSSWRWR